MCFSRNIDEEFLNSRTALGIVFIAPQTLVNPEAHDAMNLECEEEKEATLVLHHRQ